MFLLFRTDSLVRRRVQHDDQHGVVGHVLLELCQLRSIQRLAEYAHSLLTNARYVEGTLRQYHYAKPGSVFDVVNVL